MNYNIEQVHITNLDCDVWSFHAVYTLEGRIDADSIHRIVENGFPTLEDIKEQIELTLKEEEESNED